MQQKQQALDESSGAGNYGLNTAITGGGGGDGDVPDREVVSAEHDDPGPAQGLRAEKNDELVREGDLYVKQIAEVRAEQRANRERGGVGLRGAGGSGPGQRAQLAHVLASAAVVLRFYLQRHEHNW